MSTRTAVTQLRTLVRNIFGLRTDDVPAWWDTFILRWRLRRYGEAKNQ